MKSIRLIRLALALVLLMLVVIVVVQFDRPEPQVTDQRENNRLNTGEAGEGASVSGGEQLFYRDGKVVARLTFDRAVTKDSSGTLVEDVRLFLEDRGLTIHAPRARIADPVVELMGDVILESASGNHLSLAPPVRYKAPILSGAGQAEIRSGSIRLDGIGFQIHTGEEWIRLKKKVHLRVPETGLEMSSSQGLYRFEKDRLVLVHAVRFRHREGQAASTGIQGTSDMALVEPAAGSIRLFGRGKARWEAGYLYFTQLNIESNEGVVQFHSSAPALMSTAPESWLAYLPEFTGSAQAISSPWSMIQFANGFFSVAQCRIHPDSGMVSGDNPFGQVNMQQVKGSRVSIDKNTISIEQPVVESPDGTRLGGSTLVRDTEGGVFLAGPVTGSGLQGLMIADSGRYREPDWYFENSVWWTARADSWVSGHNLVLKNGSLDHVRITGNVSTLFAPESGMSPVRITSGKAELEMGVLQVSDTVVARQDDITIRSDLGYVTGTQGVFLPSAITMGNDIHATGKLLILPLHSTWGWLFGEVNLTDARGNRATGHKLTFERTTGRISMYKGKDNVKISLTL